MDFTARIAESRAAHLSPAIGAVWVGADGLIQTTAHGVLSVDDGRDATNAHHWHIGSCTKAMTATVFARLVQRGLISFDTPLANALPMLEGSMAQGYRDVPLRDVLTHSAGIARDPADSTFRALRRSGATASAQRAFLAKEALKQPPRPEVGYSNLGYILIGAVIEQVTGLSWESALAQEVMIPLSIGRFGFGPLGPGQPSGHIRADDKWRPDGGDNPEAYGPAGRVHLALDEWGRFLRAHLTVATHGYLESGSLAALHTPAENRFAMGWLVPRDGELRLVHTGSNTAWYALAMLLPDRGIAFGIVCNAYDERIEQAVGVLARELIGGAESHPP